MIRLMFLYVESNCLAIAILLVIVFNMHRKDGHYSFDQKLFLLLLAVNIILLSLDTSLRFLYGRPGDSIRLLHISAIVLYNTFNPVICMIWYYYVDYYICGSKERARRLLLPILLPVFINAVLSVAGIFADIYHVISADNIYTRGPYIHILFGVCIYIILYTAIFTVRNREKITRREFIYLLFFAIPPTAGATIQFMTPGLNIIWISTTLSIFIIFINIQREQLQTDYLTGVNNRRCLDSYLQTITKTRGQETIAGIMIDIDDFKMINDVYGHDHGDQALKHTAQILKKTFRRTDFIARYGGDEFMVVMNIDDPSELTAMAQRLNESLAQFNAQKLAPYKISLSVGYDYYDKQSGIPIGEFLKKIDHLMYLNKQKPRGNGTAAWRGEENGGD